MSFQPSRTETIKTLFHGNRFIIPPYQRKYSWHYEQRKALWDDISENLEMHHFIGTLCFKKNEVASDVFNDVYEIIDGQQRSTTLYLLLNALIEKIEDANKKEAYTKLFIGEPDQPKLIPLGSDMEFMKKVIFDFKNINPEEIQVRSQRYLYSAKRDFKTLSENFSQEEVQKWIDYISKDIEILIFNVTDEAQAVKMFSVINDRGLPLSNLDKTKSILMLYSTLYLGTALNNNINVQFGEIFDNLDNLLIKKKKLQLFKTLEDYDFENTFYTHHYYSSRRLFTDWDYQIGADSIFKQIKRTCERLKNSPTDLSKFIQAYIQDFADFSKAYSGIFNKIYESEEYQKPFQYLEFTATLYPLIVRLFQQEKLDELLGILEATEVRVYKLKNTNPRSNMYEMSSVIMEHDYPADVIKGWLVAFNTRFLDDYRFEEYLKDRVDQKTELIRYIINELNTEKYNQSIPLDDYRGLQVEHIFSVNPNHTLIPYGFARPETYQAEITKIGNLTILERSLNSKVRNMAPTEKDSGYQQSNISLTLNLIGLLPSFNSDAIQDRTEELAKYAIQRFSLQ
jgi:uncharacterized protein with ParB-like and HNH nuclease domain